MQRPERLEAPGTAFWDSVTAEVALDTAGHALLEQACRVLDRLAHIDALLAGDETEWATLRQPVGKAVALAVHVDGLLTEARQQQATLQRLLGAMNLGRSAPHAGTPAANASAPQQPVTTSGGGDDDDLARRRTRRRRAVAPD